MIERLGYKINWLKRSASGALLQSLHTKLDELAEQTEIGRNIPEAVAASLQIELLFCLLQNRRWLDSTVLYDIVIDHFATSYGLEASATESYIDQFRSYLVNLTENSKKLADADDAFLKRVIIAKGEGRDAFYRRTGLGAEFYRRIEKNQSIVLQELGDIDKASVSFLTEIDHSICKSILDVCEMSPEAIDRMKLEDELSDEFSETQICTAYRILQRLCRTDFIKQSELELELDVRLLEILAAKSLVKIQRKRVYPTQMTYEFTARGFAEGFWQADEPEYFRLTEFHCAYQKSIVRQTPSTSICDLAERVRPFLAKMAPTIYIDLGETLPAGEAVALLSEVVATAKSDWHRHFACQTLSKIGKQKQDVKEILHRIIESDTSDLVKDTALEQLARSAKRYEQPQEYSDS